MILKQRLTGHRQSSHVQTMSNDSGDFTVKLTNSGGYDKIIKQHKDTVDIQGPHDQQHLAVSFQRTVRVADNKSVSDLPPGLGTFPLYNVGDFKQTLTPQLLAKGGLIMPMYRKYLKSHRALSG